MLCVPKVLGPPVWQGLRGSAPRRRRRGGVLTEAHTAAYSGLRIESDCRFAVADEPALLAGNRRERWCIRPIGY